MTTPHPQPDPRPDPRPHAEPPVPADVWARVAAFADGELPGEDCCELLEQALAHPDRARQVRYQQQLRELLSGCMDCEKTMRCPEELRERLTAIADTDASAPRVAAAPRSGVLATIGRWVPLAAAAALFIAAAGVYLEAGRMGGGAEGGDAVLTSARVEVMETRHVRCTSGVERPHAAAEFPDAGDVAALPAVVASELHAAADINFDLTPIGFTYRVAGRCAAPGGKAVHVVYQSAAAGPDQRSLSLWLQPAGGALDRLPLDTPTVVADDRHPHPILVWRTATLEHYLVGDALADVEAAFTALTGEPLPDHAAAPLVARHPGL